MPLGIVIELIGEHGYEVRPFGTRANPTHLTTENIPDLGNLVEPRLAQETADPSDSGVILGGPLGTGQGLCVVAHGAEFHQLEAFAPKANALLAKQRWAG